MFYRIDVVGFDVFYRDANTSSLSSLKREFRKTFSGWEIKIDLVD